MTQELVRKPPDFAAGDDGNRVDYMEILKKTDPEEILEVLADGFCQRCRSLLETRLHNFVQERSSKMALSNGGTKVRKEVDSANDDTESLFHKPRTSPESSISNQMHEDLHLDRQKRESTSSLRTSLNSHRNSVHRSGSDILLNDGLSDEPSAAYYDDLSEEQKEQIRFSKVGRKKDFVCVERVDGRSVNILQGLELHTKVFNAEEQKKIVDCVYKLQEKGKKRLLLERTYSEPRKWMRGKGRVTLQFGCCYNYAVDRNGNPPGIIRDEEVDPLPSIFKKMIKRMVRWHILPPSCVPNSCIVNIYDEGDCIPPHIDHHDFVRPFCTVSFLTECNIVFGSNLKIVRPGEFSGPVSIPLPVGSVLILNGNGADVAKHCVPGVPTKRISITFRKMDDSKLPYRFSPDPDLLRIKPLIPSPSTISPYQPQPQKPLDYHSIGKSPVSENGKNNDITTLKKSEGGKASDIPYTIDKDEFPPLGSRSSSKHHRRDAGSRH